MKLLTKMIDYELNKPYNLYLVNAIELQNRLLSEYEKKLSRIDFQLFNGDLDYFQHVTQLKAIQKGLRRNSTHKQYQKNPNDFYNIFSNGELIGEITSEEEMILNIQEDKKGIEDNVHIKNNISKFADLGYELMPLVVSVPNMDINNPNVSIELLDGFRRMFYTKEVPNRDILVKVYDKLNDADWFSAMVIFNSWKFANNKRSEIFLDRGFRLGLFYRYGIDFTDMYSREYSHIWSIIDIYVDKKPYSTFYNNSVAHEDIKMIYKIFEYRPSFKLVKKKKVEEYDSNEVKFNMPTFLSYISKILVQELGQIRRLELLNKNNSIEQKPFDFSFIEHYFAREDLQEHFIKLSAMTVPGHIENNVNKYLEKDLRLTMQEYYYSL